MAYPPAPRPQPPVRPTNVAHDVAQGISTIVGAPQKPVQLLNEGFATATNVIAQALPAFPAATLLSLTMGLPHAHTLHPPSGPPPVPPTPLPPLGPILLGTCVSVLINGKPAARCGDMGLNPTCCGLPPMFEVFTGSSKVFIGGARAARQLDITYHCKPVPPAGAAARGVAAAMRVAMKAAMVAGMAAQVASIAGDAYEAAETDDSAMKAALGMSAGVMAAQMANDAAAMAAGLAMGKDICVPPGTMGAVTLGSPNVQIGGFPMPSWMSLARGLLKIVKGLKARRPARTTPSHNKGCGRPGEPVDVVTGANVDSFVDVDRSDAPCPLVRHYDSTQTAATAPFGPGFRHGLQHELQRTLDGFEHRTPEGEVVTFVESGESGAWVDGYQLTRLDDRHVEVRTPQKISCTFRLDRDGERAVLESVVTASARLRVTSRRDGVPRTIEDDLGAAYVITADEEGRWESVTLGQTGRRESVLVAEYRYDARGRLIRFTDALGAEATFAYDEADRLVAKSDRLGYTYAYAYDAAGRCVHTWGEDGLYDVRFHHDAIARRTIATFADGAAWTYDYDANGVITQITDPYGGGTMWAQDAAGRVIDERDPLGHATTWLYDATGAHTGRRDPLGYVTPPIDVEPNPPHPLNYTLPADPYAWTHGSEAADGAANRKPVSVNSTPAALRALIEARRAGAAAAAPVRRRHDAMGRLLDETTAAGTREWAYDANGNVTRFRDRDGSVYRAEYESWNALTRLIAPDGGTTRYEYSAREEVTAVIDANGAETRYTHDLKDRLIEVRRHDRVKERYRYDAGDNLIEKVAGDGSPLLTCAYGAGNQPQQRRLRSGGTQAFTCDDRGRFVQAVSGESVCRFAYDGQGRLVRDERDGLGVSHRFAAGKLAETTWFDRFTVRYEAHNGAMGVHSPTGSLTLVEHGFRESLRKYPNGATQFIAYGPHGGVVADAMHRRRTPHDLWTRTYEYSGEGDLLAIGDSVSGRTAYTYDVCHRLTSMRLGDGEPQTFEYDAADNLIRQPGAGRLTFDAGHRVASIGERTYVFNDRDNVSGWRDRALAVDCGYDSLDRLIRCDFSDGRRWTAEYDALCRRTRKVWDGREVRYFWDDFRLAAEWRDEGPLRLYVYEAPDALVPLMFVEYDSPEAPPDSGRDYFVVTTPPGIPVLVEDASGNTAWRATFSPFGMIGEESGVIAMPLRYPGHYHDPELDLFYNRFRYYSPRLGRYLQCDPIGLAGGLNLYAYPANPLTRVDLDGLHPKQKGSRYRKKKNAREGANGEQGPDQPGVTRAREPDRVQQLAQAEAARVRAECEANNVSPPVCTVAVRDKETGKVYYATSGHPPLTAREAHPDLDMPTRSKEPWEPGNCGEPKAMNQALNDGAKKENLQVASVNTETGVPKQCCRNCERTTAGTTVSPAARRR